MTPEKLEAMGKQASAMVEKLFPYDIKVTILEMPLEERMVFWGLILSCIGGAMVRCIDDDPYATERLWNLVGGQLIKLAREEMAKRT